MLSTLDRGIDLPTERILLTNWLDRWMDDVHLDMKRLFVEGSLVKTAERGVILEPPKAESGLRTVDLDDGTVDVLAEHRREQERISAGPTPTPAASSPDRPGAGSTR